MLSILDNQGKTKRYAKLAVKSELGNYTINLTQYGVNDVDFRNATQIAIVSGNAISQGDNWRAVYKRQAIYGARGANGVMLITTKTGKENEKTRINVTVENSFNKPVSYTHLDVYKRQAPTFSL